MGNQLPKCWAVKHDGSEEFMEVVLPVANERVPWDGDSPGAYYGVEQGPRGSGFCTSNKSELPNGVEILTVEQFTELLKPGFSKKDLKSGMLVKYRDGLVGKVLIGTSQGDIVGGGDLNANEMSWSPLTSWNEKLEYVNSHRAINRDIVEVFDFDGNIWGASLREENHTSIWKKEEKKTFKLSIKTETVNVNVKVQAYTLEEAKQMFEDIEFNEDDIECIVE